MTNVDIIDCSLIAIGVLAVTVLVLGGIRSKGSRRIRWPRMIAGVVLSILAGYSWVLLSIVIAFLVLPGSINGGTDWSGESYTWSETLLSELVFHQAIPCGIAIAILGVFLTVRWFFRKPSTQPGSQ